MIDNIAKKTAFQSKKASQFSLLLDNPQKVGGALKTAKTMMVKRGKNDPVPLSLVYHTP